MANIIIPDDVITSKIYLIRGMKVMIDNVFSELYGITTGFKDLKSQFVTSSTRFLNETISKGLSKIFN